MQAAIIFDSVISTIKLYHEYKGVRETGFLLYIRLFTGKVTLKKPARLAGYLSNSVKFELGSSSLMGWFDVGRLDDWPGICFVWEANLSTVWKKITP